MLVKESSHSHYLQSFRVSVRVKVKIKVRITVTAIAMIVDRMSVKNSHRMILCKGRRWAH